jgi:hypothetical protein
MSAFRRRQHPDPEFFNDLSSRNLLSNNIVATLPNGEKRNNLCYSHKNMKNIALKSEIIGLK